MTLARAGGWAALVCAASYVAGFALLITVLLPAGYAGSDPTGAAALIAARPGLMGGWFGAIYVLNGLALAVLVTALADRLHAAAPGAAALSRTLGTLWALLVLAAGLVAQSGVRLVADLHAAAPERAAQLWQTAHMVESGLGGGIEIAGAAWLACVCIAGRRVFGRATLALGGVIAAAGAATLVPALAETGGAMFGLGFIAWFALIGLWLLRGAGATRPHPDTGAQPRRASEARKRSTGGTI
ncbi:hypothetical protein [Meridianimarinicoccus roseus]|uniref:hypothetical protein n=1 Tax=Meridianimarinicoccus roseus TaxID=2072018 RepID=UPI001EE69250|nr:hypothetical protein [Meridianimarinicoccus roseus]